MIISLNIDDNFPFAYEDSLNNPVHFMKTIFEAKVYLLQHHLVAYAEEMSKLVDQVNQATSHFELYTNEDNSNETMMVIDVDVSEECFLLIQTICKAKDDHGNLAYYNNLLSAVDLVDDDTSKDLEEREARLAEIKKEFMDKGISFTHEKLEDVHIGKPSKFGESNGSYGFGFIAHGKFHK